MKNILFLIILLCGLCGRAQSNYSYKLNKKCKISSKYNNVEKSYLYESNGVYLFGKKQNPVSIRFSKSVNKNGKSKMICYFFCPIVDNISKSKVQVFFILKNQRKLFFSDDKIRFGQNFLSVELGTEDVMYLIENPLVKIDFVYSKGKEVLFLSDRENEKIMDQLRCLKDV